MQPAYDQINDKPDFSPPFLKVVDPGQQHSMHDLVPGSSVLIGSGANCGIQLAGDKGVMPVHCMVRAEDGYLWVHDWNTDGGTLHNGESIQSEAKLKSGDELRIGNFCITPILDACQGESQPDISAAGDGKDVLDLPEADPPCDNEPGLNGDTEAPLSQISAIEQKLQLIEETFESNSDADETHIDRSPTPDHFDQQLEQQVWESAITETDGYAIGSAEQDEVSLLNEEIAQLQHELAERDAQIMLLNSFQDSGNGDSDNEGSALNSEEASRLVNRLEELLAELDSADQRILTLEDLLRMSDEANRAEQEERQQLEAWVQQIEELVSQREAETRAELKKLEQRTQQLVMQRDHVEAQLQETLRGGDGGSGTDEPARMLISDLRKETDELHLRAQRAEHENEQLKKQLEELGDIKESQQTVREVEQAMRELEVETAKERAEFARQRVELARLRDELEQQTEDKEARVDDADRRFQAMRQHLRDIHEEEKQEKQERRGRGLSGRISRLWQRLDRS